MRRGLCRLLFGAFLGCFLSLAAPAQDGNALPEELDGYLVAAEQAEQALSTEDASTSYLETLRSQLADWRTQLLAGESLNQAQVESLEAQLQALGPPPEGEDAEPEADGIANQRAELQEALEAAQAPGIAASAAYSRVNSLIGRIDTEIRERQNQLLLESVGTPLNPVHWPGAIASIVTFGKQVVKDVENSLGVPWFRASLVERAPLTVTLAVLGIVLLVQGRVWMSRATEWMQRRSRRRGRISLGFLVSLGQVALPLLGMALLGVALVSTGILDERARTLLDGAGRLVLWSFLGAWITGRVFPTDDTLPATFDVSPDEQRSARRAAILIGILVGLAFLLDLMAAYDEFTPISKAVLALPIVVGHGFAFYWLSRVLRRASLPEGDEQRSFGERMIYLASRALIALAVIGPLAAIAGYANLADAIMRPAALTLGLGGIIVALQAPIRDLYASVTRTDIEKAGEALMPVLVNFGLVLAAIPLLALIWGMRPAELGEFYAQAAEGFSLGEARITPGAILAVVLVFAIGLMVTRLFQAALKSTVLPRTKMDVGAQNAVSSFAGYVGIGVAALVAINAGGIDLTALAVVFGALSVGIGFGLQNVVQNFVAGIILLIERPIGEGDWIEVGGQMGIVKDISVRSTTIETFAKQQVIVPNADFISGTVTNWTRGSQLGRVMVNVGVAYGTDTRRVHDILMDIVSSNPDVAAFPEPGVDFMAFGADSLEFRVRGILRDVNTLIATQSELNHRIAERFTEEGIEIPFAQRDIWLRNPEALTGAAPARASEPGPDAGEKEIPAGDEEGANQ